MAEHDPFANAIVMDEHGSLAYLSAADTGSASVAVGEPEPASPTTDPAPPEEERPELVPEEGTEADEAPEGEEEPAAEPTGQERFRGRFSDLAKARDLAQEREAFAKEQAEFWKQRALDAQRPPPEAQSPPPPPPDGLMRDPQGRPQRPRLEQYATQQDYEGAMDVYEDAVADWHVQRHVTALEQRRSGETALGQVRQAHPDYEQVVQGWTQTARLSNDVAAAIAASPQRYELCYYLATHPEVERTLANQYGPGAFYAIGELQARMRFATEPPMNERPAQPEPLPPISNAPPPIRPTRGEGRRAPRSYEEMTDAEFFEIRNKEANERRWR